MGKYKFYQDRKVTSWERDYFSVKANSYEEAEAIVRSWNCEDVSNIIDNRLCTEKVRDYKKSGVSQKEKHLIF